MPEKVGQGVAIQDIQKGVHRLVEDQLQSASGRDHAVLTAVGIKTLHDGKVGLNLPHELSEVDLSGFSSEPHPAATAANGLDIAQFAQVVDDLHQVVGGDVIRSRDVSDGSQPVILKTEVNQHPEAVVGIRGEPHREFLRV
jgi:hypothetical protein